MTNRLLLQTHKIDYTSLDSLSLRTPVRRKHLGDISYTRRVIGDFVLNFVAMATGLVTVEFVCHSIAGTRSPRTNCKNLGDICYKCKNTYQSKTHCKDDAMKSLH